MGSLLQRLQRRRLASQTLQDFLGTHEHVVYSTLVDIGGLLQ